MPAAINAVSQNSINGYQFPYTKAVAVTPSDAAELTDVTRGIMVTAAGNIAVFFMNDSVAVTIPVAVNTIYPFMLKQVKATGTTATGIIAFF